MAELIELKCKNCGGLLSSTGSDRITCHYCGTSFLISSSEHVSSDVDEEMVNAEYVMQSFNDYEQAYHRFFSIIQKDPKNYRGYLGILKAITKCFTDVSCHITYGMDAINDYIEKLYIATPDRDKLALYKSIIVPFTEKVNEHIQLCEKLSGIQAEIDLAEEDLHNAEESYSFYGENYFTVSRYKKTTFRCFILSHSLIWLQIALMFLAIDLRDANSALTMTFVIICLILAGIIMLLMIDKKVVWVWQIFKVDAELKRARKLFDDVVSTVKSINNQLVELEQEKETAEAELREFEQSAKKNA